MIKALSRSVEGYTLTPGAMMREMGNSEISFDRGGMHEENA